MGHPIFGAEVDESMREPGDCRAPSFFTKKMANFHKEDGQPLRVYAPPKSYPGRREHANVIEVR
jgi:hypothetical protein